jgi:hypothetical protein
MEYRIDPEERARFKRCRRQWDFASPHRRDLEPVESVEPGLAAALNSALAVYYYPGTWDWQHELKQSLVYKALERSLSGDDLQAAAALLDCYDAWARTVDNFAPVKIGHDVQCLVADPRDPERALLTPNGIGVHFTCRVDLLAVDSHDDYWIVRHQIVEDWLDLATILRDEEAIAACWAWEQDYIGMEIAGTIHNEVRIGEPLDLPGKAAPQTRVAQHEPSGGGRSIPQHQRASALASRVYAAPRVDRLAAGVLRRTRVRRTRDEISAAGAQIAAEALEMTGGPAIYPNPAAHCGICPFVAPCLALFAGSDPQLVLSEQFRKRPADTVLAPRLGQSTWGFGRGAGPPRWKDK